MVCKIRIVKQHIRSFLGSPSKLINDARNQKILVIFSFVFLFSCLLFLLFGRTARRGETISVEDINTLPVSTTSTITPTKWWIRSTSILSPSLTSSALSTDLEGTPESDCPTTLSSPLHSGIFAYISLTPSLPNRIRSSAGKTNSYIGQIEPGAGVRVLDGPLCADGLSWWLVESAQGDLRGWTAEGRESEQWIIPCPNQTVACDKKILSTQSSQASKNNHKTRDNECRSEKLAVGIPARVEQGSLLVIRSEPIIGDLVGRVGPLSVVNIVNGPSCTGGTIWWNVNVTPQNFSGWVIENNLQACSKEDGCG